MFRRNSSSAPRRASDLIRGSVILSAIDRFTEHIYNSLKNGFFGSIFTAYPLRSDASAAAGMPNTRIIRGAVSSVRRFLARTADQSCTVNLIRRLIGFLLRCRLRVYGTFLLTFGVYSALSFLLSLLGGEFAPVSSLAVALVCAGSAFPLLTSDESLSGALLKSSLAAPLLSLLGIRRESIRAQGKAGRSNLAFIAGMALGLLTFFVPAILVAALPVGIFFAYRVFVTPELGIALLFLGMPFLPTMALVALVSYIALCCLVKLILGKRRFRLETVDAAAFAFAISVAFGGLFSFSSGSRRPALVLLCFLGAYFLCVLLLRTYEWLLRCTWCAVIAASAVALYGVYQYFTGSIADAGAWLDSSMFTDISGRVVSTLENPNMLAEYLILLFPLAAAQLLRHGGSVRKICAFFACASIGACIILTWSRGAWLGLLFAGLVFLLIWSRRTIYLILVGAASVPLWPLILPDSIVSRFTSIGNIADTSTSYRVNIWHGAVRMLGDYWYSGIGIGEAAWSTVYPRYSLAAIETAPHAHNLYLQVWVEMGIVGLALLLIFLFLLVQYACTYFRELSHMSGADRLSLFAAPLKAEARAQEGTVLRRRCEDSRETLREITSVRLETAAPLCGILATLVQGFTDYTWYNYRVYLMFWLCAGLCAAFVRCGHAEAERVRGFALAEENMPTEADLDLPLAGRPAKPERGDSRYAKD